MNPRITPAEAAPLMPVDFLQRLSPAGRAEVLIAQARAARAAYIMAAIANAFQALARRVAALRHRQRTEEELSQLSDRALADIGVTRGDIPEIAARTLPHELPSAANDMAGTRLAA